MQIKKAILLLLIIAIPLAFIWQFFHFSTQPDIYSEEANGVESGSTILNVPFIKQKPWYCSEASAAMVLQYYDHEITQDQVHENGYESFEIMVPFLSQHLSCEKVQTEFESLKSEIEEGDPVIIRLELIGYQYRYRHTVVVVGYENNYLIVHDPAGTEEENTEGENMKISSEEISTYWERTDNLAIIFD